MKLSHIIGTSAISFCLGVTLTAGGLKNDTSKNFSIAGLAALPIGFLTYLIVDTKATQKVNESKQKLDETSLDLNRTTFDLQKAEEKVNKYAFDLSELKAIYDNRSIELAKLKEALVALSLEKSHFVQKIESLQQANSELNTKLESLQSENEQLFEEVDEWENQFKQRITNEAEKIASEKIKILRATEIQQIFEESDKFTQEAIRLFRELQEWGHKVAHGHRQKKEIITNLATNYNTNLDELNSAVNKERVSYLEQIELLNEKVARLQHQLAGDLIESEYLDAGYGYSGQIANAIAKYIWDTHKIPLKVFGFEEKDDGSVITGFGFSKSQNPDMLVRLLTLESKQIAKALMIHEIHSVLLLKISPTVALTFRREKPPTIKDEDIYRRYGLEKADNFGSIIRKYHNHEQGGKPTIRIMGGTGGGKSLAAKIIIKSYVEHEDGWEIRVSDPQDGSSVDFWNISKVATDEKTAHTAFKEFVKEFDARSSKSSRYAHQKVLGVFDEFDKMHSDDDKEEAKRVWTAIRHQNQRLVLMGQSSQVGANGWQWDDMRNCVLLFVSDAIITAIGKYKELGWDLKTKNKIDRNYRVISDWMNAKNEELELPPESAYRLALLVSGSFFKFLEIPKAVIGGIDDGKSWIVSEPWEKTTVETDNVIVPEIVKPVCPKCGSNHTGTKGIDYYRCHDCGNSWKRQ